ncbi:MAG: hypothetical protein ACLP07_06500 [Terracidiphilus sp.]
MEIQALRAQLVLSRKTCSFLANELKASTLTDGHKAAIAHLWYKALKDCHNLQFVIELLERQDRHSEASVA